MSRRPSSVGPPYSTPPRPSRRGPERKDFKNVDDKDRVVAALQALYPDIDRFLIVGSRAIQHRFPEYRDGRPMDWDFVVPNLGDFRTNRLLQIQENLLPGVDAIPLNIAALSVFSRGTAESVALVSEFEDENRHFMSIGLLEKYYLALDRSEPFGVPKAVERATEIGNLLNGAR